MATMFVSPFTTKTYPYTKADSSTNEIPATPEELENDDAEASAKIPSETTAATTKSSENEVLDAHKAGVTATTATATAATSPSTADANPGPAAEQKENPATNSGPSKTQEETQAPAQSILPPIADISQTTSAAPANPGIAAPTGVPTQHTAAVPVAAPTSVVESSIVEKGEVSTLYVGRVIGKGGEMIRDLQARSGCQIDVDQNVPHGAPRIITYKGTPTDVAFAKQLVAMLCRDGAKDTDLPLGKAVKKIVQVPSNVIGKIIGRGGEMIRELQNKSRGKIQVDHSGTGMDEYRQVIVTGVPESVVKAEEMINFLCANPSMDAMQALQMLVRDKLSSGAEWGSGPPYHTLPNQGQGMTADTAGMGAGAYSGGGYGPASSGYGGYGDQQGYGVHGANQYGSTSVSIGGIETEVVPCAKMHMGRVIGQKGVTINDLQKRSGCDIQINQQVPVGMDCQISIKGSRQGIDTAKQMIQEIIELGSQHPYAGGHGSKNQYGGQQGYPQQSYSPGAYASQAYSQGAYPAQAQQQPYTQQYGMPQQQYYGGQPMYQQQQSYQAQPAYGGVAVSPAASPWRTATSADGQIYYYNSLTNETSWDKPPGM
mmetsp:Transcript_6252/g.9129  ORF Transcript_6252/g.9129 Transcript_6252/m.9129 type:complete len:599 (-) Transcript_6252:168-1964(-)